MNKYEIAKQVYIEALDKNEDCDNASFTEFLQEALWINNLFKKEDLIMVTLSWSGGRWWDWCEETFICPTEDWERFWKLAEWKQCYLWEVAGKHSEIYWTLDKKDIVVTKNIDHTEVKCNHSMLSWMGYYFEDNLEYWSDDSDFVFNFINTYGQGY